LRPETFGQRTIREKRCSHAAGFWPINDCELDEAYDFPNDREITNNMRQWVWNTFFRERSPAWTAIFTGVLVFFTFKLYQVAERSDETSRATQRAFIGFSGIGSGVGLTTPDRKLKNGQEIYINWTNSGTTPAKNAVTNVNGEPWPVGTDLSGFDFHDLNPTAKQPLMIGPKEMSGVRALIPLDLLRNQREGKARVFFWGWIVYDDIFPGDPPRLTEFCTEMIQVAVSSFEKDISDPSNLLTWNTQRCPQHNCYDEGCQDYSARIKEAASR